MVSRRHKYRGHNHKIPTAFRFFFFFPRARNVLHTHYILCIELRRNDERRPVRAGSVVAATRGACTRANEIHMYASARIRVFAHIVTPSEHGIHGASLGLGNDVTASAARRLRDSDGIDTLLRVRRLVATLGRWTSVCSFAIRDSYRSARGLSPSPEEMRETRGSVHYSPREVYVTTVAPLQGKVYTAVRCRLGGEWRSRVLKAGVREAVL